LRWATRGESYDVDLYEAIIPAVLEHVASGVDLLPAVAAELAIADQPDPDTLGRLQRAREAAARKLAFDRDLKAYLATTERLDREEQAERARKRSPTHS
jgi:hypothetical protein